VRRNLPPDARVTTVYDRTRLVGIDFRARSVD
jgi:hypothetical protein